MVGWVLLLGAAFTFFQSSTFSQPFQNRIQAKKPVTGDLQEADGESIEGLPQETISVYPPATRKRLVDLLLATGFFFAAAGLLTDRRSITFTMIAISAVGVCLSGFGIVQKLSFSGKIYGVYELLYGGSPFGPYVNGNNASGFLLITFAGILFFVANQLFIWGRKKSGSKRSPDLLASPEWGQESRQRKSIFSSIIEVVSIVEPKHLYFLTLVAVIVAGICMTFSRSGIVAMLAVALVVFSLIARTQLKASLALAAFILVAGMSLVVYIDTGDQFTSELESLSEVDATTDARFLHWGDAIPFAMDNLPWGVGNGTYRYVSPYFQTFFYPRTFAHAESLYVETFVELGIVGLALVILAILMLAYSSIVLIRRDDEFDRSLGIVGLGALIGQAAISVLDFGLYQPPSSILMATMMGMVAGRAAQITVLDRSSVGSAESSKSETSISASRRGLSKALQVCLAVVLLLCTAWAIYASYGIESTKLASRKITYFERMNKRTDATKLVSLDADNIQALLDTARAIDPDDADVLIQLGELKVAQARLAVFRDTQADVDQQIKEVSAAVEKLRLDESNPESLSQNEAMLNSLKNIKSTTIWSTTAPISLHQMLRQAGRRSSSATDIFGDRSIVDLLADAYDDFSQAEEMSPLPVRTPVRLAQLAIFKYYAADKPKTAGLEQEQHYVDVALKRSFRDTQLMFSCGFLALNSGDQASAVELWSKCLRNPHYNAQERAIVSLCIAEMPMNLFFEQILPQNPARSN